MSEISGGAHVSSVSDWAEGLSDWKSDALRRQVDASALSEESYAAIFRNAKAAFGIGTAVDSARCGDLTVPEADVDGDVVTLLSVGPMKGVDRLAANQTLAFAETGITAIYGNNGVGKSGYSRVLKQLCRAVQGSKTALRGDAFVQKSGTPPAVGVVLRLATSLLT